MVKLDLVDAFFLSTISISIFEFFLKSKGDNPKPNGSSPFDNLAFDRAFFLVVSMLSSLFNCLFKLLS